MLELAVATAVWRDRPETGSTWLSTAALAVTAWAVGHVVSSTTQSIRLLGSGLSVVGALASSGSPLVFAGKTLAAGAVSATLFGKYGPLLIAQPAYGYALLFVSEPLLCRMFLGTHDVFRERTFLLLVLIVSVAVCTPEDGDGFYVADDGPGVPADQRDGVLGEGFTTNGDGTGFGLSISQTIVEARGWKLTIAQRGNSATASNGLEDRQGGSTGGARFDVTGENLDGDQDSRPSPTDRVSGEITREGNLCHVAFQVRTCLGR